MEKTFRQTREDALLQWLKTTKREITIDSGKLLTDNLSNAFECEWQGLANDHVSLFCSLGEWGSNITDSLMDSRFDDYHFENEDESEVLFRYYTRMFLVISEMLTDFQDIYKKAESITDNKIARNYYFQSVLPENNTITQLLNFINKICKHKTNNFHICNHHNEIRFEDAGATCGSDCFALHSP